MSTVSTDASVIEAAQEKQEKLLQKSLQSRRNAPPAPLKVRHHESEVYEKDATIDDRKEPLFPARGRPPKPTQTVLPEAITPERDQDIDDVKDRTERHHYDARDRTEHDDDHDIDHFDEEIDDDDYPMAYSGLNLPEEILGTFRRAGYALGFFGIETGSVQRAVNIGWRPVRLEEVPRWSINMIPVGKPYEKSLEDYCVYTDLLLMKIKQKYLDHYQSNINQVRLNDKRYVNSCTTNGQLYDTKSPSHLKKMQPLSKKGIPGSNYFDENNIKLY